MINTYTHSCLIDLGRGRAMSPDMKVVNNGWFWTDEEFLKRLLVISEELAEAVYEADGLNHELHSLADVVKENLFKYRKDAPKRQQEETVTIEDIRKAVRTILKSTEQANETK